MASNHLLMYLVNRLKFLSYQFNIYSSIYKFASLTKQKHDTTLIYKDTSITITKIIINFNRVLVNFSQRDAILLLKLKLKPTNVIYL